MRDFLSPVHRGLVHLVTAAVLIRAVRAGQFVSGLSDQLPTAIHVLLGVGIFAGAVALSGSIRRSMMTSTPDRWQGGAEHARTATAS